MYAPAQNSQFSRIVATLLAIGALSACGYKGPLYMAPADPAQSAPPAQTQAQERSTDERPAQVSPQTRQPSTTTTPSRAQ